MADPVAAAITNQGKAIAGLAQSINNQSAVPKTVAPTFDATDLTPYATQRFLAQWKTYMTQSKIVADANRISTFQDCCKGYAYDWSAWYLTDYERDSNHAPTWAEFLAAFEVEFVPTLATSAAQNVLFEIKQKPNEALLPYIARAGKEMDAYIAIVSTGCAPHTQTGQEVFSHLTRAIVLTATMHGLRKDCLTEINRIKPTVKNIVDLKEAARHASIAMHDPSTKAHAVNQKVDAIDLSSVADDDVALNQLAHSIDYLRTKRASATVICHKCRKPGHIVYDCPEFVSRASSRGVVRGRGRSARRSSAPNNSYNRTKRAPVHAIDSLQDRFASVALESATLVDDLNSLRSAPDDATVHAIDVFSPGSYEIPAQANLQDFL